MKNKSNKVYIYNQYQARFYIKHGMRVLDTGIHYKTHRPFYVFDYDETKEVYHEWAIRKH